MLNEGIKEVVKLNKDFYSKHNESFDKSRSYGFWEGFEVILKYLPKNPKILDLGCGNARFLKFLLEKNYSILNYDGFDNSSKFIEKNQEVYQDFNFVLKDVIIDIETVNNTYDLIVAFGITHHIPSKSYREIWFKKIASLVSNNGVIVLSFWNFNKDNSDPHFYPKVYKNELNDFYLGWKGDFNSHRYCHFFEESEIKEITSYLENFKVLAEFKKDFNTYLVLQKTK
jgi:SAM-dependent methyltransferase